jgi:S1-C subfamily serine protease
MLDGEPLRGAADLVERISLREPGSKVKFVLWRDGKRSELEMTLGQRPMEHRLPEDAPAAQPEIE